MIEIRAERCTGCGACLEVCPVGAIYLVDGTAVVDETLCRECDACISACPVEAILHVEPNPPRAAQPVRVPVSYMASEPTEVNSGARRGLFVATVLPVVGAALKWAGHEIMPRLADQVLANLEQRTRKEQYPDSIRINEVLPRGPARVPQPRRHRRRGNKN